MCIRIHFEDKKKSCKTVRQLAFLIGKDNIILQVNAKKELVFNKFIPHCLCCIDIPATLDKLGYRHVTDETGDIHAIMRGH